MRAILKFRALPLPFFLFLAACSGPKVPEASGSHQAAVMTTLVDESASTAFISSPAYSDAAIKRVGQIVTEQQLGDQFRIVTFGARTTDHAVDELSIASGYKLHLPTVRKRVEATLSDLLARTRQNGGDGSTNILFTLQNSHLQCTPRSRILILSDGIEESDVYSVGGALAAGKPVHLPTPSTAYLRGCSVALIGLGVSPEVKNGRTGQTLPEGQLQALTAGWREYLLAAGVLPADMAFTSII